MPRLMRIHRYLLASLAVICLSLPVSAQQHASQSEAPPAAEPVNADAKRKTETDPDSEPASDTEPGTHQQMSDTKLPDQHPLLEQPAAIAPQPVAVDTGESELAIFAPLEPQGQSVIDNPAVQTQPSAAVPTKAATEPAKRPGSGLGLGKMALSLAIVVGIVLVLGWGFKKLTLRLPGSRHLKIVSTLPLGPKERLLVVEVQGKQRVIGVTPHSINLLFELENPLPEEKLASNFHTQLQSFLKK